MHSSQSGHKGILWISKGTSSPSIRYEHLVHSLKCLHLCFSHYSNYFEISYMVLIEEKECSWTGPLSLMYKVWTTVWFLAIIRNNTRFSLL